MTSNMTCVHDHDFLQDVPYFDYASQDLVQTLRNIALNVSALFVDLPCTVALLDPSGEALYVCSSMQAREASLLRVPFCSGEGVESWVIQQRAFLLLTEAAQDIRVRQSHFSSVQALLSVPLIHENVCIGALTVTSPDGERFDQQSVRLLTLFAQQVALTLWQMQQTERGLRFIRQLEQIIQFSQRITSHLELAEFYISVLADVRQVVVCTRVQLFLYQEPEQQLLAVAAWSVEHQDRDVERLREPLSVQDPVAIAAWVARHRNPALWEPHAVSEVEGEEPVILAELAVPLISKETLYGVLVLCRSELFSPEELRVVRNLSTLLAVALEIAQDMTTTRAATRIKANFLSMITHELRSPLNAINGYLDLTLTGVGGELNAQQYEFVQRARAGSEHLYALLEDLLLISRADSGQMRLNCEIIRLPEVIENAVEELELTASDNGVQIHVSSAPGLPRLYADRVRIQQVLRNLINNALRFTPSGGHVTITVTTVEEAGPDVPATVLSESEDEEQLLQRYLRLQVQDTGSGIAAKYHQRIFERFFQAPNEGASRAGGQGLGLAIVKMIVELHNGTVTVESTPGHGSTFICLLPCLLN